MTPAETLATLTDRHWRDLLTRNPILATAVGVREHDGELPDESPAARREWGGVLATRAAEVAALPAGELGPEDDLSRRELGALIARQRDQLAIEEEDYLVSHMRGPHLRLGRLTQVQSLDGEAEAEAYLARLEAAGPYLDRHVENLRRGLAAGRVSATKAVQRVARQLSETLARPTASWRLASHAAGYSATLGDRAVGTLDAAVRPALARQLAFLLGELLPKARPDTRPGLCHLDGGAADYARAIHSQTSLEADPQAVHDRGLEEVGRLHGVILPLAQRCLGTKNLAELRAALDAAPELHFKDEEDVLHRARVAVQRGTEALKTITSLDPGGTCRVLPIPAVEAPHAPLGYYQGPAPDGSRPGTYYVNTHAPTTKLAIDAEGVAYHEAVPGHHLQIAVAQRLELPAFRRFLTPSAFAEGWALYSEKLADELGLYSGDLDRLGMFGQDLWRAARLVLDTGLHALGWSRQEAVDFARRETLLPPEVIENEIDRFVVMPGQALGYKLGEFEVLKLRRRWDESETSFALADFHDAVIGRGGLSLATLGEVAGPPA